MDSKKIRSEQPERISMLENVDGSLFGDSATIVQWTLGP